MKVQVYNGENFVQTNEYILQLAASKTDLRPTFVLVPDRFTLQAERIMLTKAATLLNTRVVTFSMLYQLIAEELNQGAQPDNVIDKTSAVLHLWAAIKQVQDELQWFKKSVAHYDFAEKMFNTLNEIRSSCVPFAGLESQAKSVVAQKKYHDITLIYQKYQQNLTAAGQTDSAGMLDYLHANLKHSALVKGANFYLCGFENLSPARLQVLDQICHHAASVTMGAATTELTTQLSRYRGCQLATTKFTNTTHTAYCETPRQEAMVVAEKIVKLLNQGVAPESIVVLLAEFDTLAPVWEVVFRQYQIPTNIDVGQKLSETAEAKYLRDLLALALNDNTENTVAVMYNQTSGLDDTVFELENQIIKTNLRARYVDAVPKLPATQDVAKLCAHLAKLVTQPKLLQILTQIGAYAATEHLSLRDFAALYWTLCSATKISNIPLYVDRVLIAPVAEWVPTRTEYLFVANCNEDNFPQGQADNDILQEVDLQGTQITPTPTLQRQRNYRHALLLATVPTREWCLSGTGEDYRAAPHLNYSTYQVFTDSGDITCGKQLFFPTNTVRTTMLEKYYGCPYQNFIQNGLGLRPRDLYQLKASNTGTAIHKALETYFGGQSLDQAVAAGIKELNYDCPPIVANLRREIRFLIKKLDQSFQNGQFKITAVEQRISKPLDCGLTLVGRVDRVDAAPVSDGKRVILVLDYKTGNAPASIAKSIYLGSKLQLPVYANALAPVGEIAGAGYLSLPSGYADQEKKIEIKGFIADDCRNLFAPGLLKPRGQYYLSPAGLANLCRHANDLVDAGVKQICAGDVRAQAVDKTVCGYCPVRVLCPHADKNYRGDAVKYTFKDFEGEQGK